jgi:hypothetical protein
MPEAMDMILAILGYVMQEAKALALQRKTSVTKGSSIPISQHNKQSHNIAYQVFEDSCLDQGLLRLVGMLSAVLGHLS